MDVRCEKCQTEYELDEARLKPGGVTVKCTNCGHMFKIRKPGIANLGAPIVRDGNDAVRPRTSSSRPVNAVASAGTPRADSLFDDDPGRSGAEEAPTTVDRQWLIRLDNGEQRSCRELATLQQWIISGAVTRESLISRTGKTWKRLGDVADLGQYFVIADEARATRDRSRPPSTPAPGPAKDARGTLPGFGPAQAAGGTILPDDDDGFEAPTTRSPGHRPPGMTPPPVPPRGAARTPPLGSNAGAVSATAPVSVPPQVRPSRTPPPPLPVRPAGHDGPVASAQPPAIPPPAGSRATAMWATDGVRPEASGLPASGPSVGKFAAIPDEPAFAGRVRMAPGDEATFDTAKVRVLDDDDELLPARRGSRAGMWVLVVALLVMGAGGAAVYMFVIRTGDTGSVAQTVSDAAVATMTPDAAVATGAPTIDAPAIAPASPLEAARGELAADLEPRLRTAAQALDGKPDAPSQALRAHLFARLAQDLQDRASVTADKAQADALRKEAKQLVLDAATDAQRALKTAGDDAGANLAMAEVLRMQGKPARDIKRYLDTARAKPDKDWARELALADGLVLVRDGKLDEAKAVFTGIDQGDGALESSGDVRARLHLALVLAAQDKPGEARPLVDAILAAQPEHATARALAGKLDTVVAKTDPLPPEDGGKDSAPAKNPRPASEGARPTPVRPGPGPGPAPGPEPEAGDSYDRLVKRANTLAETSCGPAMELYARALEQKPNGVEALTGMAYCHIDAKQFASAFSKFRAALAVSSRYEPALRGIAEAYQQQGRKEQAIEAYKAYLDVYPNSVAAKKQLERLGGGDPAAPPSGAEPAPSEPTPAPPADPPAAPADDGSGSS